MLAPAAPAGPTVTTPSRSSSSNDIGVATPSKSEELLHTIPLDSPVSSEDDSGRGQSTSLPSLAPSVSNAGWNDPPFISSLSAPPQAPPTSHSISNPLLGGEYHVQPLVDQRYD